MIIKVLGGRDTAAYELAVSIIAETGNKLHSGEKYTDLIVAPLLNEKVGKAELDSAIIGSLVFHPSPLPYGRGPSAIKWAYKRGEPITAATWFWANDRFDAGDICEMEIVAINYVLSPRELYTMHILPALGRTLRRALLGIASGYIRRVPQVEAYATYDRKY